MAYSSKLLPVLSLPSVFLPCMDDAPHVEDLPSGEVRKLSKVAKWRVIPSPFSRTAFRFDEVSFLMKLVPTWHFIVHASCRLQSACVRTTGPQDCGLLTCHATGSLMPSRIIGHTIYRVSAYLLRVCSPPDKFGNYRQVYGGAHRENEW